MAGQELRAGLAQLCYLAGADEGEGSLLLGSMQGYMEQASKTVQDALSSMQESDIAVVARYAHGPPFLRPRLSCPGAEALARRLWPTKFTRAWGPSEYPVSHGAFAGDCD